MEKVTRHLNLPKAALIVAGLLVAAAILGCGAAQPSPLDRATGNMDYITENVNQNISFTYGTPPNAAEIQRGCQILRSGNWNYMQGAQAQGLNMDMRAAAAISMYAGHRTAEYCNSR